MVRTIITPTDTDLHLTIGKEYVGKTIEVTYLSLDELEQKPMGKKMGDFLGILSDETAQAMRKEVEESRKEWEERFKKQF